jgi:hypothetical protein
MIAGQRLDLDHVGAHVAEDLPGGRPGDHLCQIENQNPLKRQHPRPSRSLACTGG